MKRRIQNKQRNLQIRRFKKYLRHYPEANHKVFLSFDYLGYSDHCDCYFTGYFQKKKVLINAAFKTLRMEAYDKVYDMVDQAMDEKFPDHWKNLISFQRGDDPNEYFNRPEETRYKDWALQQKYNWEEEKIREDFLEKGIEVQPYIEVMPDYQFGVGLHGVFDCHIFPKKRIIEIIQLIKTVELNDFSNPVYFGEIKRFHKVDLEGIQHSTPLVHMPFQKKRYEKD
jgi:hypothetical protein